MKQIRAGDAIIDAQLNTGYESSGGCRDTKFTPHHQMLKASWLDTKLGPMMAIADEAGLYLLEFVDKRDVERKLERFRLIDVSWIYKKHDSHEAEVIFWARGNFYKHMD